MYKKTILVVFIFVFMFVCKSQANMGCDGVIGSTTLVPIKKTLVEEQLNKNHLQKDVSVLLMQELDSVRVTMSELYKRVLEAIRKKNSGHSLFVSLSHLPVAMIDFIEGPYSKVVGHRGTSEPFVSFKAAGKNKLVIKHEGDKYPLMVEWADVSQVISPEPVKIDGVTYLKLTLPKSLQESPQLVEDKHIHSLVSGSDINKYILPKKPVARLSALIHGSSLVSDRPTQIEAKEVFEKINSDVGLRNKLSSLLFVAPTAVGKTRILGNRIVESVRRARLKAENFEPHKKLTILTTKTPDLTTELSKNIGDQLLEELGTSKFRIVQWGGSLSEGLNLAELNRFIDNSDVPVVLVTSYPTLAARTKGIEGGLESLISRASDINIDEAHNATGKAFTNMMRVATRLAQKQREEDQEFPLTLFGVTASPITRALRTSEVFDQTYWSGVDTPGRWALDVKRSSGLPVHQKALDWLRVIKQYKVAKDRGEINATDPIFYDTNRHGIKNFFKRGSGTASSVNIRHLLKLWRDELGAMVESRGPGVIHTFPRDAGPISNALTKETGENFVNIHGLSPKRREQVYSDFRDQTLNAEGQRKVFAIVGPIREGLDFPDAGWYFSFKKYVRFPENIQGPGRVVRLAKDKLPPLIVFFGKEIDKIAFESVRDLVMTRLGPLPRVINSMRLYSGARKPKPGFDVNDSLYDLNLAMQAFVRIYGKSISAKDYVRRNVLSEEKRVSLQLNLAQLRKSDSNREISSALETFVSHLSAYPFYLGTLDATWDYCSYIAKIKKKNGKADNAFDQKMLDDHYDKIESFRSLYAALGSVPRDILTGMELMPRTIFDVAQATNNYIRLNGELPLANLNNPNSLREILDIQIQQSPDMFYRFLNSEARMALSKIFGQVKTLEGAIEDFFQSQGRIPDPILFNWDPSFVTPAINRTESRLFEHLRKSVFEGLFEPSLLKKKTLRALDKSDLFQGAARKVNVALDDIKTGQRIPDSVVELIDQNRLTYANLKYLPEFRYLLTVERVAESLSSSSFSAKFKKFVEAEIKGL